MDLGDYICWTIYSQTTSTKIGGHRAIGTYAGANRAFLILRLHLSFHHLTNWLHYDLAMQWSPMPPDLISELQAVRIDIFSSPAKNGLGTRLSQNMQISIFLREPLHLCCIYQPEVCPYAMRRALIVAHAHNANHAFYIPTPLLSERARVKMYLYVFSAEKVKP